MSALYAAEIADTKCADHVPIWFFVISADWAKKIPSGSTCAMKASGGWAARVRERATTITQDVISRTVNPELRPDYLHAVRTRSEAASTLFACGAMTALKPNSTTAF